MNHARIEHEAIPQAAARVPRTVVAEAAPLIAAVFLVPSVALVALYEAFLPISVALAVLFGLLGIAVSMTCLLAFLCSGVGWWLAGHRAVGVALFVGRGALTLASYEIAWRASLDGNEASSGAFGILLGIAAATAILSPALLAFIKRERRRNRQDARDILA